jgi:RND family efflux transporter MFP subunit
MNKVLFITVIAAIAFGCNKQSLPHEHGPDPLAYTVYSDKSEIFVEFKPLVVGSASKFAAHFTILGERFLPLNEGSVTINLIVGTKGIRQTSNSPAVPGIFSLSLTPNTAGMGKLIFEIQTKSFSDRIVIDSVMVYPNAEAAESASNGESSESNNITYLKEQAWKVEFANTPVKPQDFSSVIKTNGQILSAPGDEMIITAKADGIVLFSGLSTVAGVTVNSGTSLFTISAGDIAENNVEAVYREAKTNFEKAKADFERASDLVKDKIISQKDFLESKRQFINAQIQYNSLAKNYSATGQNIPAPMSGYIKSILVNEGQYVATGTPLAIISKNRKLMLQANVSQKYFDQLPFIKSANFKLSGSQEIFSSEHLNGKLISYGKSTSSNYPFLPVIFEIDNSENLVPGSIAEVYLRSGIIHGVMVIPASSLLEEQGIYFVYVQVEGEAFQKREVKIGATDGLNVQVLSGVKEGERVVSKGAYQIKLSSASGTMPAHGHEH